MLSEAVAGEFGESSPAEQERVESTSTRIPHRFEHYELMSEEDGKPVELGRGAMGGYLQSVRRQSPNAR